MYKWCYFSWYKWPQQVELKKKASGFWFSELRYFWKVTAYTRVQMLYKMLCLDGGAKKPRVCLNGKTPWSHHQILSREVGNFSLLRSSLRLGCPECSRGGVASCVDRRNDSMAGLQGGREDDKMEVWPQDHPQGILDMKPFPSLAVKFPLRCLIFSYMWQMKWQV